MKRLQLLPVGRIEDELLFWLGPVMEDVFQIPCEVLAQRLDPEFALHGERCQYHSSQVLQRMQSNVSENSWRVLGEAQMGGPTAILSTYRLRQEFYGLAANRQLLRERTAKEAVHELGHTLNLTHCEDYQCAMAPSHAVEWIDLKGSSLCKRCRADAQIGAPPLAPPRLGTM